MRILAARSVRTLAVAGGLAFSGCGAEPPPKALSADVSPTITNLLENAPAAYGGAEPHPLAADATTIAAREVFEKSLLPELRGHVRANGWLDVAARVAAGIEAEHRATPSRATLRWATWRAGITAVQDVFYANTWMIGGSRRFAYPADAIVDQNLDDEVTTLARQLAAPEIERVYGISRFQAGTTRSQAILVARNVVEIAPLQKSWAPGSEVTLTIKNLYGWQRPVLFADLGDDVKRLVMTPAGDGATIAFKARTTPGRMMIEVTAVRERGELTVLELPLWVGVPEAASVRELLGPPVPEQPNPEAMANTFRATYDAVRSNAGRSPLGSDPRLTELAAKWAALSAENKAGHHGDDLRAAGFEAHYRVVAQHVSLSDFGDFAATTLFSPVWKAQMLERDATFAAAVVPIPGERPRLAIVQALTWARATKPPRP